MVKHNRLYIDTMENKYVLKQYTMYSGDVPIFKPTPLKYYYHNLPLFIYAFRSTYVSFIQRNSKTIKIINIMNTSILSDAMRDFKIKITYIIIIVRFVAFS